MMFKVPFSTHKAGMTLSRTPEFLPDLKLVVRAFQTYLGRAWMQYSRTVGHHGKILTLLKTRCIMESIKILGLVLQLKEGPPVKFATVNFDSSSILSHQRIKISLLKPRLVSYFKFLVRSIGFGVFDSCSIKNMLQYLDC
uniref:Uncharacterized protein n=1 Tax=Salix viminalis TaxID=40686 RepID=A0A6N2MM73_SALVM